MKKQIIFFVVFVFCIKLFGQFDYNQNILKLKIITQSFEYIEKMKYELKLDKNNRLWIVTIVNISKDYRKCDFSITYILDPNELSQICPHHYFYLNNSNLLLIQSKIIDTKSIHKLGLPQIPANLKLFIKEKVPDFDGEWLYNPNYRVISIRKNKYKIKDFEFPLKGLSPKYTIYCSHNE